MGNSKISVYISNSMMLRVTLWRLSRSSTGIKTRSTIWAIAPSPVILHAVPKQSMAMYSAIIKALSASVKPSILDRSPKDAMIAPPGTPGAATIVTPSMATNPAKHHCIKRHTAHYHQSHGTRYNLERRTRHVYRCAQRYHKSGNIATYTHSDSTPSVTGIVAADDCVPRAVT